MVAAGTPAPLRGRHPPVPYSGLSLGKSPVQRGRAAGQEQGERRRQDEAGSKGKQRRTSSSQTSPTLSPLTYPGSVLTVEGCGEGGSVHPQLRGEVPQEHSCKKQAGRVEPGVRSPEIWCSVPTGLWGLGGFGHRLHDLGLHIFTSERIG